MRPPGEPFFIKVKSEKEFIDLLWELWMDAINQDSVAKEKLMALLELFEHPDFDKYNRAKAISKTVSERIAKSYGLKWSPVLFNPEDDRPHSITTESEMFNIIYEYILSTGNTILLRPLFCELVQVAGTAFFRLFIAIFLFFFV